MEADQSCLERGCGSLRGLVRSPQEPMSTRRWGPSRWGSTQDWPDAAYRKAEGSYIARRAACERGTPHPPFWKTKNQLKTSLDISAFFGICFNSLQLLVNLE